MKNFILFSSVLLLITQAFARVDYIQKKIKVGNEVPAWNSQFDIAVKQLKGSNKYPIEGYAQCRETVEIDRAFLCLSNQQVDMNEALGRASFYVEATPGVIVSHKDRHYNSVISSIGGHDLKSSDLIEFYYAAIDKCNSSGKDYCLSNKEKELFEKFILPVAKNGNFVLITYALHSEMGFMDVVSHEILHAQYFLQDEYREVVDNYWEDVVTDQSKNKIKSSLKVFYDTTNDLLMKNEFQAYVLMNGAESNLLKHQVVPHRKELIRLLAERNIVPVQVKATPAPSIRSQFQNSRFSN